MKIAKFYIGKEVRVTWKDPIGKRQDINDARKGQGALAKWVEWGQVDDVSEGVLRIVQSQAFEPGSEKADECMFGWIPEELIEKIEILVPSHEKEGD